MLDVPVSSRVWLRWRLTRSGTGLAAMLLLLGVVAANPGLNLLLLLFGLGVGLLLFNGLAARKQIASVEIRRVMPDVAAVHRPAEIRYNITNKSIRLAVHGLWVVDDPGGGRMAPPLLAGYAETVPPQSTATVHVTVTPQRRGIQHLGHMYIASRFPYGLVNRLRRMEGVDSLLVWPALWRPHAEWLSRTVRALQVQAANVKGSKPGADEFFGIREYRPGDNTRWIHWRRSASHDRVMVREMAQASPGHVTIALETRVSGRPCDAPTLDDLVSAAASLACDALERGWHVGLIANGQNHIVLPPAGGRAVRSRLLYELAILASGADEGLVEVLSHWPGGSAWAGRAVLLHPLRGQPDAAIEEAAARLGARIGSVAILGPDDLDQWFDRGQCEVERLNDGDAAAPVVEQAERGGSKPV